MKKEVTCRECAQTGVLSKNCTGSKSCCAAVFTTSTAIIIIIIIVIIIIIS